MPEVISWTEPTDAHGVVRDRAESSASRGAARPPRQCLRQAEVPRINEHRDAREVRLYRHTAPQPYNRTCEPAYNGTVGSWTRDHGWNSLLARSLGSQRRHLRNHPYDAVQRAACVGLAERGAVQELHHAGRALPRRFWPRLDPCGSEGTRPGSDRAVRESGRGRARGRARVARFLFQAVRHHAAGVRANAAVAGVSPLRLLSSRHGLWRALRSAARRLAALLLDLRRGGKRHSRP